MSFSFEKLDIYKKAVEFANDIYEITKDYPKSEIFGITNQLRRASLSMSLNIAEGSGRSKKEFRHFLDMARTSGYECIPILEISKRQGYISDELFNSLYKKCNELVRSINALKNSIREL